ncbi:MAG: DUF4199 domain-containing protein [Bacteroidia bacterium]|nr:DUF4199 domain-containing protein [Bacteroidia bacterium]
MEPLTPTSKWQIVIKFSLIFALTSIGVSVVFYILGMHTAKNWISTFLNFLIISGSIYFGIRARRDETLNGFISFGQGVGTGMQIIFFGGLIISIYFLVFVNYIDPEFMANLIENVKREMIEKGDSEEKIETTIHWMKKMQSPMLMFVMGLLANLIYGLIVSLIVSIFTRKENPDGLYNTLDN